MIRKHAIITAASIAGVILAGGAAVGANVGILGAADNGTIGNLSAESVVATAEPLPQPSPGADEPSPTIQTFAVDAAGEIDVERTGTGLAPAEVRTSPGWAWQDAGSSDDVIAVRFSSASEVLEFRAALDGDGAITATVERPTPDPASTGAADERYEDDDRYEDEVDHDDHDDDDHGDEQDDDEEDDEEEDDDHDEDEHEEYEGRDDDD